MASRQAREALQPYQRFYFCWDRNHDPILSVQPPIADQPNLNDENLDLRAERIREWVGSFISRLFCKPQSPIHYDYHGVVWKQNFTLDFSSQKGYLQPTIYVLTDPEHRLDFPEGYGHKPFPHPDWSIVLGRIQTIRNQWRKDHYAHLFATIRDVSLPSNITKLVCFGLGSLFWDPRFDEMDWRRTQDCVDEQYSSALYLIHENYRNHVVASELAELLRAKLGADRELKVYCHDVRYSGADRSLLRDEFNMVVLQQGDLMYADDMALAHVDDNTFVYCTDRGYGHPSLLAGYCRPAGMICRFIDTSVVQKVKYTGRHRMFGPVQFLKNTTQRVMDPCPSHLRTMLEEYDMTSLLEPASIRPKAGGPPLHRQSAYRKLVEDAAVFPAVKRIYNEAKRTGNQADIDLLGARLADVNLLAKGCAGHWSLALYARHKKAPKPVERHWVPSPEQSCR